MEALGRETNGRFHYLDVNLWIGRSNKERKTRTPLAPGWPKERDHSIISAPISRKQAPPTPSAVLARAAAAGGPTCDVGGKGGYEMHICSELRIEAERESGFTLLKNPSSGFG